MDALHNETLLLIGAGPMAQAYHAVLKNMKMNFVVLGRGETSAKSFFEQTGIMPTTGELVTQLANLTSTPKAAIVAVNAQYLTDVCKQLMENGVTHILVEKPATLDRAELEALCACQIKYNATIYIGYNRRFMSSVERAREIISEDGGLVSIKFDFSEPSRRIAKLEKPERELLTWFYGNSSHVVDLAFHFFGTPNVLEATATGSVSWHPDGAVFAGFARNEKQTIMSWSANWLSPGRWGMELLTPERRLIMQPLEKLRIQTHENFNETDVEIDDSLDSQFKPGLYKQVEAFLKNDLNPNLPTLQYHQKLFEFYELVRTGKSL